MSFKHPNLFVMIPYSNRNIVEGFFDLDIVGEEYANLLGNLTDSLSEHVLKNDDKGEDTIIATILRAGQAMSNRLSRRLPKADVVQISMRRNLKTLTPFVAQDEFNQVNSPEDKKLIITDPALATGGSILKTLELAKKYGFRDENIIIMAMFGCQIGLERIIKEYPSIKIYLVHLADGIREDGYLLPYNGDTGDRLYGVRENEFII